MSSNSNRWHKLAQFFEDSPMASFYMELAVRFLLLGVFMYAEFSVSEAHVIQPEDMWRYRYPLKESQVPFGELCLFIIAFTTVVFYWFGLRQKYHGGREYGQATLGFTCSVFVTGVITNILKSAVGRPRPNYLVRCYGPTDYLQVKDTTQPCIPSDDLVGDLRKSFPSGHSSTAFSAFVYLSLYMAGKLGTFNSKGRGCMWRLLIPIIPVFGAAWVGVTRFTDYHHHFDDILSGSVLGAVIAYVSYRRYYPSLREEFCHLPCKWVDQGILSRQQQHRSPRRLHIIPRGEEDRIGSEPLIGSQSSPTRNHRLQGVSYNNSDLNLRVYVSRQPSSIKNNADMASAASKASIAFYWDENDVDGNGAPLLSPQDIDAMRQELLVAFAELARPPTQNIEINGHLNE